MKCVAASLLALAAAQPPSGGGGGSSTPTSSSSHACSMLGDVALTTATGTDERSGKSFVAGENVYGPFEAGFTSAQDGILAGLGCATGKGYVDGGIDTLTAGAMMSLDCGVTIPRVDGDDYIGLVDECGGHTSDYHFHERLSCLYDATATGHSTKVAEALDNKPLYGKHEDTNTLPNLDACGGHFGKTPESPDADVYHYHIQENPPFTIGCFGPNDDGGLVTIAECRSYYTGCGDGDSITITTAAGESQYDLWCPCYDADGSNVGTKELAVFSDSTASTGSTDSTATTASTESTDSTATTASTNSTNSTNTTASTTASTAATVISNSVAVAGPAFAAFLGAITLW